MHQRPANHRVPSPTLGTLYTLGYTAEVERCHRRLVADLAQACLPGVQVIHLLTTATGGMSPEEGR